ncbi:hypothetical protein KKD62_03200 [Patescibacteria group bacterium]|nr:hypothetical protein [Patescibacteria group bacterium]MBU1931530.1 hypothetical protein [Patescibacteria group bacterium]
MDDNLPNDQPQQSAPPKSSDSGGKAVMPSAPGVDKEKEVWVGQERKEPGVIEHKEPVLPKETEGWLEKLEKGEEIKLPQPITDDTGQVILDDVAPQVDKVELPLTEEEIKIGLHQKIWDSIRWLAAWCFRMIKLDPKKFIYHRKRKVGV